MRPFFMNILLKTLFVSITAITLSACGGSSNNNNDDNDNDIPIKDTTSHKFDGTWVQACEYDADLNEAATLKVSFSRGYIMDIEAKTYNTQDCSGKHKELFTEEGIIITYQGELATGSCRAEKVYLFSPDPNSDITPFGLFCIDENNQLRTGKLTDTLTGKTADKRPTSMDMEGAGLVKQ